MAAAGLYKGYEYLVLTQAQVDAIDAASPAPAGQEVSKAVDAMGYVQTADIEDESVDSDKLAETTIKYAEVALTKANILAMYATPIEVIAAPGAGKVIEFLSAVVILDYATAAYTGGGGVSFKYAGAATVSQVISAANSFGDSADKIAQCVGLDTANGIAMSANTALQITNASGAFTDPGTAAGVGRLKIAYRIHTTGL